MPIRIRSKRAGFRRCGVAHPAEFVDHPDDRFTPEQVEILRAEPMLEMEMVDLGPADPDSMTVVKLLEELQGIGVAVPKGAKKADLVAMLKEMRTRVA
jgi:hypothetical protein